MRRVIFAVVLAALVSMPACRTDAADTSIYGASAWRTLKQLLTTPSCGASGPCDLDPDTTIGGSPIGGGGGSSTSLNQAAGETDLRYDATAEVYYYDVDGDASRDTDGTERALDILKVEVPGDYTSVQAALDSDDCKKGTTTADLGCHIRVANGTYAEKFEISSATVTADAQYSIIIEGSGSAGYGGGGTNLCATTFTGDGTLNNNVISIDDAIGVVIRNLCIDMDTGAANDPKYAIALGSSAASNTVVKHVVLENISIFGQGAASGAGILLGNSGGTTSDTAYNTIRNVFMEGVRTCVEVNAIQTVGNIIDIIHCTNPTATIGGINIGSSGGQINVREFYMSPGAANQIGINIRNEAVGAIFIQNPTFEWDEDDGTFINFDATGNTGAYRSTTIIGGRFQPQTIPGTRHVCIDWNRRGTLNVIGNSFESSASSSRTCEIDLNNPSASSYSDINWIGNDVQWAGVQSNMVINETSSGGPLRVNRFEAGSHFIGEDGSLTFEGATLDGFETTVSVTDPTADRTVTIPDANSVTVRPTTCTGTDKVSEITSSGVVTCTTDGGGAGSSMAADTLWDAAGDLAVGTGADAGTRLSIGSTGQVLRVSGGTAAWGDFDIDFASLDASNDDFLDVAAGGTGVGTLTDNGVVIGNGTSDLAVTAALTNGQIVVGVTGADPAPVTMSGDATLATGGAITISANSVALTTDTTGNYAAGDAEAGSALTGDSATAFFSVGTVDDARIDGSAEADEVNPTLGTQTQGNYVATIADSGASEVTVTGSGSETAAVTLAIASSITRDTELAAKSAATSIDNAVSRFDSTSGDVQASTANDPTYDDSGNVTIVGDITTGSDGLTDPTFFMLRDTDDAGYTECGALNGVFSCGIDADGVIDGSL